MHHFYYRQIGLMDPHLENEAPENEEVHNANANANAFANAFAFNHPQTPPLHPAPNAPPQPNNPNLMHPLNPPEEGVDVRLPPAFFNIMQGQQHILQLLAQNHGNNNPRNAHLPGQFYTQVGAFAGKSNESYVGWFENFEQSARAQDLQPRQKALCFPSVLRDGALQYFGTLTEDEKINWENIKLKFTERYNSQQQQGSFATRFQNRGQKFNESVADYACALRKLGRAAFGTFAPEAHEILVKMHFLSNL